jgi:hypothetical protein
MKQTEQGNFEEFCWYLYEPKIVTPKVMYQTYHNREIVKKFSQIRKEKIPGVHLAANKIETHRKPI